MGLVVSLVQMRVAQSDPADNIKRASRWIAQAVERGSDLCCLPEMWTTGFNWAWNAAHAGEHEEAAGRVALLAREHHIWLCGSMPLAFGGGLANTCVLFASDGSRAALYRKAHLFSFMKEDRHLVRGDALTLARTPWGAVGLAVCYDIRFPEVFRTYALGGARLVLLPAAFPYPRLSHWKTLVRARAIENQLFMAAVNQVGREGYGEDGEVTYFGSSVIVDPWGEALAEAGEEREGLITAKLDLDKADEVRARMCVFQDRRPELYDLK